MFEFACPWLFLLVLLPLPVALLLPHRRRDNALLAPFFHRLQRLSGTGLSRGASVPVRGRMQQVLLTLAWLALVTAAARPQWLGEPVVETRAARDLMVAVDLSGSMAAEDFVDPAGDSAAPLDRLAAVKAVLASFARQRPHDRLGLIVFGDAPYLQAPFTEDHSTWETLLGETDIAMAGQGTAIGDAIGLAIKYFRQSTLRNRVLILLTDGNDTSSRVPPVEAAKVALRDAIRIYTIAIGDPASGAEDAPDVETLGRVAEITGGAFFQARDPGELARVQDAISALEPEAFEMPSFQPKTSLHHYPVAAFMLLYLASVGLGLRRGPGNRVADNG